MEVFRRADVSVARRRIDCIHGSRSMFRTWTNELRCSYWRCIDIHITTTVLEMRNIPSAFDRSSLMDENMRGQVGSLKVRTVVALAHLLCAACSKEDRDPRGLAAPHAPQGFAPAAAIVRADERTARCNTVHSLTLPNSIVHRYSIAANDGTAVISCSLQADAAGESVNVPARVRGIQTSLDGVSKPLDFDEILDDRAVSYLSTFSIDENSWVEFEVSLIDEATSREYLVGLRQEPALRPR